jgi:hypothetical protein
MQKCRNGGGPVRQILPPSSIPGRSKLADAAPGFAFHSFTNHLAKVPATSKTENELLVAHCLTVAASRVESDIEDYTIRERW